MNQIKLANLSYTVENEEILKNISHGFIPEGITGILAPVEEKISHLLKIIDGVLEPTSGVVTIDNFDLFQEHEAILKNIRKKMAFVFERRGILANLSILENLLLPLDYHFPELSPAEKKDKIETLFDHFEIQTKILLERPARLHPQILKMMLLIRAFVMEPDIILYDNPLLDLGLKFKKAIFKYVYYLKEEKKVTQIFTSTSDILFEIADENLVLNNGNLIEVETWENLILSDNTITQKIIKDYLEVGINETKI